MLTTKTAEVHHIAQVRAARNDRLIETLIVKAHVCIWMQKLAELQDNPFAAAQYHQECQRCLLAAEAQYALPVKPRIRVAAIMQRSGGAA